jgi:RNA polymerase sigma-70 factor, ECF subfamily
MTDLRPSVSSGVPDELLARRAAAGDEDAVDELYRRYAPRLSHYAARLLGDFDAGQRVSGAVLASAFRALRRGTTPTSVQPWLYRSTLNAALELREREPAGEIGRGPGAGQNASVKRGALTGARRLRERERHVSVLRDVYGMRIDEIAAELGLGTQQVEQALFAARNHRAGRNRHEQRAPEAQGGPCRSRATAGKVVLGLLPAAVTIGLCLAIMVSGGEDRAPGSPSVPRSAPSQATPGPALEPPAAKPPPAASALADRVALAASERPDW